MTQINQQKLRETLVNIEKYAKGQDCGDFFIRTAKKAELDHAGQIIKAEKPARTPKQYKFTETIELQVGLKNYDPKKDPRFNAALVLPNLPKTNTRILVLADANDVNRCQAEKIEYVPFDTLASTYDKTKPGPIKRWAKKYDIILCSKSQIKNIVKVLGPTLTKINRQPLPLEPTDNLKNKVDEMLRTIRIQFKKVLGLNWPVGQVSDKPEDIQRNIMMAVNTLVDNLKKGWQNIKVVYVHSTMGPSKRIF
ncbi:Ribosomal_protein L10a [Hexamita inflata]|uniref:Ribosomal protein L10a n=1 Tax=Hexamita inflata TaxID=28002 RepID=A0AA86RLE2_9EUKA|nr:Ribosomal protein L10a [Hexamita inflata]